MSTVRIGPSRQVTLPEDVLEKLDVGVGDALEAEVREGKLVLTPKSASTLAPEERKLLQQAKRKIARIRNDMARSRGLTPAQADVAARAGLIDLGQRWRWTEAWQSGERQAERDIKAGRVKVFDNADELKDVWKREARTNRMLRAISDRFHRTSSAEPPNSFSCSSIIPATRRYASRKWKAARISGKAGSPKATASRFRSRKTRMSCGGSAPTLFSPRPNR